MKESDPFADGCRFQVTFEVMPGDVSGVQRARRWLKCSLRSFGLKNVSGLVPVKPPEPEAQEGELTQFP